MLHHLNFIKNVKVYRLQNNTDQNLNQLKDLVLRNIMY